MKLTSMMMRAELPRVFASGCLLGLLIAGMTMCTACNNSPHSVPIDNQNAMVFLTDAMGAHNSTSSDLSHSLKKQHVILDKRQYEAVISSLNESIIFTFNIFNWDKLHLVFAARHSQNPGTDSEKIRFTVRVKQLLHSPILLKQEITMPAKATHTAWHEATVDTARFIGQKVRLELRSENLSPRDDPNLEVLWGDLVLWQTPRQADTKPNIILISLDTAAARHLKLYEYTRQTSPYLDTFRQQSVMFTTVIAPQCWTLTSHISLLTGLYPDIHGVTLKKSLPSSIQMLPIILKQKQYYSAGLVNNYYLNPKFGYDSAFDRYDFNHGGRGRRNIAMSNRIIASWIDEPLPQPFFLFYHIIDPHSDWGSLPYEEPEPFLSMFNPGTLDDIRKKIGQTSASLFLSHINAGQESLTPEMIDRFARLYDGGLLYTDHHLGQLLSFLRRKKMFNNSLIIITADHGEEFMEHGHTMHTQGYEENIRIPLLIKFPKQRFAGLTVETPVTLVDIVPTIADYLGITCRTPLSGTSLLPLIRGQNSRESKDKFERFKDRPIFSKGGNYSLTDHDIYVIRQQNWKGIWYSRSDKLELYNLKSDPWEQVNLAEKFPAKVKSLRKKITQFRDRSRQQRNRWSQTPVNVEPDERDKLKALGYVTDEAIKGSR